MGLRQADSGQRLHALLRAHRSDARQHGRLRHRSGYGSADADARDSPEGAPQPDHRGPPGSADRFRLRLHRSPALRLLPAGPRLPAEGHRGHLWLVYPQRHAGGRPGSCSGRHLRHRHGLLLRGPQRPGDRRHQ